MTGHCSNCGKIWTLETRQGLCQWCGKLATCQTTRTQTLRSIKSSLKRIKRQADNISNGYNQLEGNWGLFYKVAKYFVHRVRFDDRQDFLHDLMLEMARVKAKYEAKDKPLTEAGLMRVASYELTDYWVKQRRLTTWLDCGNCSKEQRRKCREELLYSDCPKFHQLISLNTEIDSGDGHKAELIEFLADDKAIDIEAWLDEATWRLGYPQRLVEVAKKSLNGIPLDRKEQTYLNHYRARQLKKSQKTLF